MREKIDKISDMKNIPRPKLNEYLQFSFQNQAKEEKKGEKLDPISNKKNILQIFQTNGGFFFSNNIKKNGRFFARSKEINGLRYKSNNGHSTKVNDMTNKGINIKTTEDVLNKNSEYLKIFSSRIFPIKETKGEAAIQIKDNLKTEDHKNKQPYIPNNARDKIKVYSLRKDYPLIFNNLGIFFNNKNKGPYQNHIVSEIRSSHRKKSVKKLCDMKAKVQISQYSNKSNNKVSPTFISKQGKSPTKTSNLNNQCTNNKKNNLKEFNTNNEMKQFENSKDEIDDLSNSFQNKVSTFDDIKKESNLNTMKLEKRSSCKLMKEMNEDEIEDDFDNDSPVTICHETKLKSNTEFKISKYVYSVILNSFVLLMEIIQI